jgi:hypothetical protein
MIRAFYASAGVLLLLLAGVLLHYLMTDRSGLQARIDRTVAVTGLAAPALCAAWYEPRLRRFEASLNPAYPELLTPDRQNFVYGDLYGK